MTLFSCHRLVYNMCTRANVQSVPDQLYKRVGLKLVRIPPPPQKISATECHHFVLPARMTTAGRA